VRIYKLLLISHSSDKSGAPRVLLNVAEGLCQRGYDITLCFPEAGGIAIEAREKGFKVLVIENPQTGFREEKNLWRKIGLLFSRIRYMWGIRRETKRGAYDLIYVNSAWAMYAGLALAGIKTKRIWHIHEDLTDAFYNRLKRWFIKKISDCVLFVSPSNMQYFGPRRHRAGWEHVPNGIRIEDIEHFSVDTEYRARFNFSPGDTVVLSVSYISYRKGIDILLRALALVAREFPEAKSVIVGDTSRASPAYLAEIEKISGVPELKGRVFFPGHCSNIPSMLDCATIFVLASRNDPMPLSVIEAMAQGKAIVATDVGCLREMLNAPSAGLVVPPENPKALAEGILTLLRDAGLRVKLGAAARKKARRDYSMETFHTHINQIIERVLKDKPVQY